MNEARSGMVARQRQLASFRPRLAVVGALATGALLWGLTPTALAVVAISWDGASYTVPVDLDPSDSANGWLTYSSTCPNVGDGLGSCTGAMPGPIQSNQLFSWGGQDEKVGGGNAFDPTQSDYGLTRNSVLEVTYTGATPITVDKVKFVTPTALGTDYLGPTDGTYWFGNVSPNQGRGTMVVYEPANSQELLDTTFTRTHYVNDQRVDVYVVRNDNSIAASLLDQAAVPQTVWQDGSGGGADLTARGDNTDFFDGNTGGFAQWGLNDGAADDQGHFDITNVTVNTGDRFVFQFYEAAGRYNNTVPPSIGEATAPDAYYGDFNLIITPAANDPSLAVAPASGIDFGTVRAGDTTAAQTLTASNDGDADTTLTGVTFGALTGINTDALTASAAPTGVDLSNPGGVSETTSRTYGAAALGKNDTAGKSVDATQGVTSTNGTVNSVDRSITASVKGPILGVAKQDDSPDTTVASDWADYGSTINLGDYSIGDSDLLESLVLANIFGAADGNFTMLTFYNVGITSDAGGSFSIDSGDPTNGGIDTLTLQAQDSLANPLMIRFAGSADLAYWTATLSFSTDQNSAFGTANPSDFTFTLRIDNAAFAPAPGVLALLSFGLVSLAASRRRHA